MEPTPTQNPFNQVPLGGTNPAEQPGTNTAPAPQVFGPQLQQPTNIAPTTPESLSGTGIVVGGATAEPIVPQAPVPPTVPMPGSSSMPDDDFTSNPFISFAKGLGGGLLKSPGAVMGTSVMVLIIFGLFYVLGLLTVILAGPLGFIGILVALLAGGLLSLRYLARGIYALHAGGSGISVSYKDTASEVPFKTVLSLIVVGIASGFMTMLGFLLLIIPGFIIWARISLAPIICVVEKKGPFASIGRSWNLTKHHTWDMLGASIVQTTAVGSTLLLLVGMYGASVNRYEELLAREQAGNSNATKTHWSNYAVSAGAVIVALLYVSIFAFGVMSGVQKAKTGGSLTNPTTTQSFSGSSGSIGGTSSSTVSVPTGQYCYYDGPLSDMNAKYTCTNDKTACLANVYCKGENGTALN